jgi:phage/plasmid-like protein (TIGR03299 family)
MSEGLLGNWNVRKLPEFTFTEDGQRLPVPGRFAVVRDNPQHKGQVDVIGSVGSVFHPIQNEEHTTLLTTLADESGSPFVAAGALDNGKRVFITMKMPGHILVGGVDKVENYLTALNGHDGSTKFSIATTPIRDACTNVLNMGFMGKPATYTVRHTKNSTRALVGEARRVLDLSFAYLDGFQEQAERLINTTLTETRFEEIITAEYGPGEDAGAAARTRAERKVEQMIDLFAEANTQAGIRGTAWAGLNAMTEWNDHYQPVRGNDRHTARTMKAVLDPSFKNKALALMANV